MPSHYVAIGGDLLNALALDAAGIELRDQEDIRIDAYKPQQCAHCKQANAPDSILCDVCGEALHPPGANATEGPIEPQAERPSVGTTELLLDLLQKWAAEQEMEVLIRARPALSPSSAGRFKKG